MQRIQVLPLTLIVALFALPMGLAGCDSVDPADPVEAFGTVEGQILAGNGQTPVPGVTVTLATATLHRPAAGAFIATDAPSAVTDREGRFVLEGVPAGDQPLVAQIGNFRVDFTVEVMPGATVEIPEGELLLQPTLPMAHIEGDYDTIEAVIEAEGFTSTLVDNGLFGDLDMASQFGSVFLNCDTRLRSLQSHLDNARAWMENGGTLYISDLSGATANQLIEGFDAGSGGTASQTITASIVLEGIRDFVDGRDQVDIRYDLSGWYRIRELPEDALTLLEGVRQGQEDPEPLAVAVPVGQGRLVFTTFHNTANLTDDQLAILRYFIYL